MTSLAKVLDYALPAAHFFYEETRMAPDINKYPPYNIFKNDGNFHIEMAVSGFSKDNIEVEMTENILTIKGSIESKEGEKEPEYLHRGLAKRDFTKSFDISKGYEVVSTTLVDGILTVVLKGIIPKKTKIEIK